MVVRRYRAITFVSEISNMLSLCMIWHFFSKWMHWQRARRYQNTGHFRCGVRDIVSMAMDRRLTAGLRVLSKTETSTTFPRRESDSIWALFGSAERCRNFTHTEPNNTTAVCDCDQYAAWVQAKSQRRSCLAAQRTIGCTSPSRALMSTLIEFRDCTTPAILGPGKRPTLFHRCCAF